MADVFDDFTLQHVNLLDFTLVDDLHGVLFAGFLIFGKHHISKGAAS